MHIVCSWYKDETGSFTVVVLGLSKTLVGTAVFQVKSQQAEVIRILDSKSIQYVLVDISVGTQLRDEMRSKAGNPTAAPPQLFNEDQYCGVRKALICHIVCQKSPSCVVRKYIKCYCVLTYIHKRYEYQHKRMIT